MAPIDGDVRTLDDTTIQFDTAEPTGLYNGESPFLYTYILPQHVWEQIEQGNCPDGTDPCTPKSYSNVPQVGSGPFVMAEYKVGEFVRMERNPYWPGPKPAIDEIIYRIYKTDDAIATALQTGRSTSATSRRPTSSTRSRTPTTSTRWWARSLRSPRSR